MPIYESKRGIVIKEYNLEELKEIIRKCGVTYPKCTTSNQFFAPPL